MRDIKSTVYILSAAALFITALPVNAAESCRSELGGHCVNLAAIAQAQPIPGIEFLGPAPVAGPEAVGQLLIRIYVFGLGLVVLAAFVGLVLAGGAYLLARDSEKWTSMARTWAGNAIFGLVLALLSYLLLVTINPELIQGLNLDLRPITNSGPDVGIISGENVGLVSKGSIDSKPDVITDCIANGGKIDSIGKTTVCITKDATQMQKLESKFCVFIFTCKSDGALCNEAGGKVVPLGTGNYCTKPFKDQTGKPPAAVIGPEQCVSSPGQTCALVNGSCLCSPN